MAAEFLQFSTCVFLPCFLLFAFSLQFWDFRAWALPVASDLSQELGLIWCWNGQNPSHFCHCSQSSPPKLAVLVCPLLWELSCSEGQSRALRLSPTVSRTDADNRRGMCLWSFVCICLYLGEVGIPYNLFCCTVINIFFFNFCYLIVLLFLCGD